MYSDDYLYAASQAGSLWRCLQKTGQLDKTKGSNLFQFCHLRSYFDAFDSCTCREEGSTNLRSFAVHYIPIAFKHFLTSSL